MQLFKHIRWQERGLKKILGDLEYEIMKYMWDHETATARDAYEYLRESRKIAYTTVSTVMMRLADKSLLDRVKDGQGYRFSANCSKADLIKNTLDGLFSGLLDDFGPAVMSQFVHSVNTEPSRLDELERLITERRKRDDTT